MTTTAEQIVDVVMALDPLAELPRTGWILRGVPAPESIADHSYAVAIVAMMLTDALRAEGYQVDGEKVLKMALLHDAAEAATGDIPMPRKTPELSAALAVLEKSIVERMLPPAYVALWQEAEAKESLEARIVAAADKIQMMAKVLVYEKRRGAHLPDFWANPANYRTMDLQVAEEVYAAIRARRSAP